MGRKSIKENKNIYQLCREEAKFTREKAQDKMKGVSKDKIIEIEDGAIPKPYEVVQMAELYKRPELCYHYCSKECEIGKSKYKEIHVTNLPTIVLDTIDSLNEIYPLINRFIQISKDGQITDDEIKDFAIIKKELNQLSVASSTLNLWVEKTSNDNNLNEKLLDEETKKLNK